MPRDKLDDIINDFKIENFVQFFRLKTQSHGNFRLSNEKLHQYDDSDFSGLIKLGQIEFTAAEKLIVIGAEVKRDLSEHSGKKNQYEKTKKILKELAIYSAGIFIFYDANGNFRFSLIYPKAVGRRREWPSFRRFTYFVSKEFTNKTFLSRIGDGDFSSLAKIKDAFSVEKVTKEFYLEYRRLFENLVEELSKNHTFLNEASRSELKTENFAKKLLGQIVFLYFVQRKGWIGVSEGGKWGEGDKNFLSNLFKEALKNKQNFFNDCLEKLFYNALNNPRRDSADPSFSKDFNCRIPFLNGGLFEAEYNWKDSLICLDNKIFQEIFNVFDRYNFTVEEESPDDKEIAVDPEMLGKIFENLLPENLRKGKGTYYTPREIVYYMCQESLINYLDNNSKIGRKKAEAYVKFFRDGNVKPIAAFEEEANRLDKLLEDIKICDPACGSGAFLVGMLNEIVRLRLLLRALSDELPRKSEYKLKKETIQNCIYGVDIDPGAIEIAKLRLWLQLVVDYELRDIEPLPNLDYRLMCGNSLLEEFEGIKFYNGGNDKQQATLLVDTEKEKKIVELRKKIKEYFNIHDDSEKQQKRREVNDIKDWLVRSALERRERDLAAQRKIEETNANMLDKKSREKYLASWGNKFLAEAKIKEVLSDLHSPKAMKPFFIWKLEFIDVFEDKKGFDVIIANPPYIDSEGMVKEGQTDIREAIQKTYSFTRGNWDIYIAFLELAFRKMNDFGMLTFITPDKWISKPFGDEFRKNTIKNIYLIVKAGREVFESSKVDSIISFFSKQQNPKIKILEFKDGIFIKKREVDKKIIVDPFTLDWLFSDYLDLLMKIDLIPTKASSLGACENACATSDAYKLDPLIKNSIKFDEKTQLKIINTGTIGKYYSKWGKQEMTYLGDKYLNPVVEKEKFFTLFKNSYAKKSIKPKIILKGLNLLDACLDTNGNTIPGKSTLVVTSGNINELKLLLAIINNKLTFFYLKERFVASSYNQGIGFTKEMINNLPVPKIAEGDRGLIIAVVDKILTITKSNDYLENSAKQVKVKDYEKKIDQMVYKLYGLTPEETKIIKNER